MRQKKVYVLFDKYAGNIYGVFSTFHGASSSQLDDGFAEVFEFKLDPDSPETEVSFETEGVCYCPKSKDGIVYCQCEG